MNGVGRRHHGMETSQEASFASPPRRVGDARVTLPRFHRVAASPRRLAASPPREEPPEPSLLRRGGCANRVGPGFLGAVAALGGDRPARSTWKQPRTKHEHPPARRHRSARTSQTRSRPRRGWAVDQAAPSPLRLDELGRLGPRSTGATRAPSSSSPSPVTSVRTACRPWAPPRSAATRAFSQARKRCS